LDVLRDKFREYFLKLLRQHPGLFAARKRHKWKCFFIVLRLAAQAGMQLRVEASTNLVDWEAQASFTTQTEAVSHVDAERPSHPQRFFRIVPEFGDLDQDD
jgi:hypothetical protein